MVSASGQTGRRYARPVTGALPDLPRVAILTGPTPLQRMERLSEALGGRAELWIKREDAGPLPFSGNKLRNLEFVLGAAIADGSDSIVTSGRRWSNHCRLAALAGTRLGLDVHLVLGGPQVDHSPNVDLIELFGGTVHRAVTADRTERESIVDLVATDLRRQGRRVTVVPVGGSGPVGAWGQVHAALEVADQAARVRLQPGRDRAALRVRRHAGGARGGVGPRCRLGGQRPARDARCGDGRGAPGGRASGESSRASWASWRRWRGSTLRRTPIELDASPFGEAYGRPTDAATAAAALLARTEGILVDPVYTAKALAGLIDVVRAGAFDGLHVVFWHGGGLPAIFEDLTG